MSEYYDLWNYGDCSHLQERLQKLTKTGQNCKHDCSLTAMPLVVPVDCNTEQTSKLADGEMCKLMTLH